MNNLQQRAITGVILTTIILTLIYLGIYTFILLLLFINLGGLLEFYRLFQVSRGGALMGALTGSSFLALAILILAGSLNWHVLLILVPLLFIAYLNQLYADNPEPFKDLAYMFLGVLYVSLPLCFFGALAFLPNSETYNTQVISGCFMTIWASDTGAYVIGKYFGKHPLFKRISPHKTWEGSAGGLIASALTALLLSHYLKTLPGSKWLVLSAIIIVTGTYGDFFKSMLKRSLHVKDTGELLPGHGGILDRFDSLLGSAPFIFTYLALYGYPEI